MKTPRHGDIISFQSNNDRYNYVAVFDKFDEETFRVSRFLVHRTKQPTLKDNEGDGVDGATLWAGHYNKLKVLRRKTLP